MKFLKYFLLFLLLLVLIFFGMGIATPSVNYDCEVEVSKSIEEAWAVMNDESKLPQWIDGYQKSVLKSGTENTVGAVSEIHVIDNGEAMVMEETITALEANKHIAMTFTMDFMDMDYEMHMNDEGGKTTIRTSSSTKGNGMMARSILSFMPKAMKSIEEQNLNNLKKLIDENTDDYFSNEN